MAWTDHSAASPWPGPAAAACSFVLSWSGAAGTDVHWPHIYNLPSLSFSLPRVGFLRPLPSLPLLWLFFFLPPDPIGDFFFFLPFGFFVFFFPP